MNRPSLTFLLIGLLGIVGLHQGLHARATKDNVGKSLPALKIKYLGEAPALEGKPMILEFWATWCPPCRQSIPHLNEVYKKYKDKGLEIVGVTDEDRSTVRSFIKDLPIDYHIGLDDRNKLGKDFGVTGIPHAMLINKEGKIVWEGHPMSLKDSDIEGVLK